MTSSSQIYLLLLIFAPIVLFFTPAIHRRSFPRPQSLHLDVSPRQAQGSTTISSSPVGRLSSPASAQPLGSTSRSSMGSSSSSSDSKTTSRDSTSTSTTTPTTTSTSTSTSTTTPTPTSTSTVTDTQTGTSTTTSTSSSTTSSTSNSASRSSTLSPTPAPSPSRSSSSPSTSITSETSQVTSSLDSQTTLVLHPDSSTTIVVQTYTPPLPVTTGRVSSSSTGFLQNKGAVAGTFTVIALVLLGAIVAIVFFVIRRKRRATTTHDRGDSEFFTSFAVGPGVARGSSARTMSTTGHSTPTSPGPSVVELAAQAPMDAYATNQRYLSQNYGYNYPSSALHGLSPVLEQEFSTKSVHEPTISEPSIYSTSTQPTQLYYIPPPGQGAVPAVQHRKSVARGSYQPSIDSFYGAA